MVADIGSGPDRGAGCLLGGGVLAIWHNVDPEDEAEFNLWYTRQHLQERVGIEGFLRARRYVEPAGAAIQNESKYLTFYEIDGLDTLTSRAYMERLNNPTGWSQKVLPTFRNGNRRAYRVVVSLGAGVGGHAITAGFNPMKSGDARLRDWLRTTAIPATLDAHPLVTGIHLLESDEAVTRAKDTTEEGRAAKMAAPASTWAVMVEGIVPGDVERAALDIVAGGAGRGMAEVHLNRYQLMHALLH